MTDSLPIRLPSKRRAAILDRATARGFVTIEGLAAELGVSAQTVRRDIIALSETGHLQRFHGGAGPGRASESARLDHSAKRGIAKPEKIALACRAAELVPDGAAVFLDVGTTVEACAHELARREGFRVFTNSLRTALAFDPSRHELHVLGGRLAGRDGSLVGAETEAALRGLTLDMAIIACSAVEDEGRVMDFDLAKIAVKRAAMANARQALLLATTSKFGRTALGLIAQADRFDAIVTEAGTTNDTTELMLSRAPPAR